MVANNLLLVVLFFVPGSNSVSGFVQCAYYLVLVRTEWVLAVGFLFATVHYHFPPCLLVLDSCVRSTRT